MEPIQGNCTDGPPSPLNSATKCFDGLWDASALFTMVSRAAAAPLLAALQQGGTPPTANFTEVPVRQRAAGTLWESNAQVKLLPWRSAGCVHLLCLRRQVSGRRLPSPALTSAPLLPHFPATGPGGGLWRTQPPV